MAKLTVTEVDSSVGRRIQLRRKELGLTASQLSEWVGLSQQQLSRYERGTNKINLTHLVNIASSLDTPIGWFFLDCEVSVLNKVASHTEHYATVHDLDLQQRLQQVWVRLSLEQQRRLISLLDVMRQ